MALKITQNQGIYQVKGSIVAENVNSLRRHCEQLLFSTEKVILCLDKVKRIDASGVHVLNSLFKNAMKENKIFYIIGRQNEQVKNAFGKVNYMLKNDYL
ncbi:STAS domain-containing protein [Aquimarina spongiae]|uniref:Anti-anti-sigma factor n=1 Tax=Aquimarina spongiae TaxID=570521 RepID=A0A1M6KVD6_9FLAO|nr:STAS domain-containing protein [Aquimarina spongiae]SHJ62899.1 anti-anti-sigma factor [Aquimarina spongiae]